MPWPYWSLCRSCRFFFLAEGRRIADAFIRLLSTEENHQAIREVADELNLGLRKYIRAKVILGGCSFAFYSTVMLLARFPHAIALGILGGVLEFIPVAGWINAATAIVTVGAVTHSHWIWRQRFLAFGDSSWTTSSRHGSSDTTLRSTFCW